ncbi:MAG: efflux RND transporter periplasmic adaptor subunit [Acidobacteriota bacterium]
MNTKEATMPSLRAALCFTGLVVLAGCGGNHEPAALNGGVEPPAMIVNAAPAQIREWVVTVPVSGDLRSRSEVEIKTEVGGRLQQIHCEEGAMVRADQVIAEVDATNYELARNQAQAALEVVVAGLERARVALDYARREKERADNLLRTGGITEKDHQAAENAVREAEAQVSVAEAQRGQAQVAVRIAEKALRDCRILAPADGRVQRRHFDEGSLLVPGSPVCSLVDNARLELECNIPSYRLSEIRTGQPASFTTPTWGERRFEGTVHSINPMVEADNRSVRARIRIPNPREELRSGMFAQGEIEVRREPGALVIPRPAFMADQSGSAQGSVFVVEGGHARRRSVEVVDSRRDLLWIRNDIREGDLVVVEVGPALKDGGAVQAAGSPTGRP